jgi:hypothetical protein
VDMRRGEESVGGGWRLHAHAPAYACGKPSPEVMMDDH